jgi:hypothetical protein
VSTLTSQRSPDKRPALGQVLARPIMREALAKFVAKHGAQGASFRSRSMDVHEPEALRARVPSFAEMGPVAAAQVGGDPRSAFRRKQQIQMELVAQQQRLSNIHSERRSSQKRMRQATPTKMNGGGRGGAGRYGGAAAKGGGGGADDGGRPNGGEGAGRQIRNGDRAFVVANGAADGTVVVRGGGGRTFTARVGGGRKDGADAGGAGGARQQLQQQVAEGLNSTMGTTRPPKLKKFRSTSPLSVSPGRDDVEEGGGRGAAGKMMDLDDGGAEVRALSASIENLKGQLVDINQNLRQQNRAMHGNARLANAASALGQSLELIGILQPGNNSMALYSMDSDPYSSDTFERDDDDDDGPGSGSSSRLSDVGRSLMQIGLDDSIDLGDSVEDDERAMGAARVNGRNSAGAALRGRGNPLRVSHELPSGSQLVHVSATPSGVMDDGRGKATKQQQDSEYYRRK